MIGYLAKSCSQNINFLPPDQNKPKLLCVSMLTLINMRSGFCKHSVFRSVLFYCSAVVIILLAASISPLFSQVTDSNTPVIVRPGAPGQPTKILPPDTKASLPPHSKKDVEFMQGMIMHHAQAVEMTALIEERTTNKDIRLLGAKISQSQADEMNFMKRWLSVRGESSEMPKGHNMHGGNTATDHDTMPGMLSPQQMKALREAKGADFDRLFLEGMIQHHEGALVMVKDLFDTAGAGQDAEIFNFSSDVDSGQRAEIEIMRTLLRRNP